VSAAHRAQNQARLGGDEALAGAIEARIVLYVREEPFIVTREAPENAPRGTEQESDGAAGKGSPDSERDG